MERKISFVIPKEYSGKKLYEYLRYMGFSRQNLTDLKFNLPGSFLEIGGNTVLQNHILRTGDILNVCIIENNNSEKIVAVDLPLDISYEDEDIVIINKGPGMPIHPSLNNYDNSLANALMYYYNSQGKDFVYRVINRLDRDTTGLTMVAKNIVSANILHEQQKQGLLKKEYIAIVEDNSESLPSMGTIDLPISRKEGSTIERIVDRDSGEKAITHYELIGRNNGLSYVKLSLDTGRTHQIRVHMKAIGHPLIGDFLYNPEDKRMNRQALHVSKLIFLKPFTGEEISVTCPLPKDMNEFF